MIAAPLGYRHMNLLEFLVNAMYRDAEGRPDLQRLIVSVAQGHNDRMAQINHTEPVQALPERR